MKYYVEITLLPNAEVELFFLWEKLYQQLHLAFVEVADEQGRVNVGVSFPQYDQAQRQLGDKLRLFAETEEALARLQLDKWLARLRDYIDIDPIRDVPQQVEGYAFFKRLSDKGNKAKLARRRAKKLGMSFEEALAYFAVQDESSRPQVQKRVSQYPFISMTSLSSERKYPVTIICEPTESLVFGAGFNTYGLSADRRSKTDIERGLPSHDSSVPIFP